MFSRGASHRKLPIKWSFIEPRKKGLELIGRRWGQDEANEAQSGEEETKTRPRRAKIGPRWGQDGPRWGQDGPELSKIGPRWARSALRSEYGDGRNAFSKNAVSLQREHRFGPLASQDRGQDCAEMGPRGATMGPRWGYNGARWAKNGLCGSSWVDIGQKLARNRAEKSGRIENGRSLGGEKFAGGQDGSKMDFKMDPRWIQEQSGGILGRP